VRAWLALVLVGCAAAPPRPPTFFEWVAPHVNIVHVASWPTEPEVSCYLAEEPPAAVASSWPEESDVFKRTMTPRREHEDLIQNVNDLHELVSTMRTCIVRLMDRTQKVAP